jgi:hypothetical protein
MKTQLTTILAVGFSCALGSMTLAGDPHTSGTKGQPNQSCENSTVHPGKAATSPGSAFNEDSVASAHYANPGTQGGISSGNSHVVSQYDVACYQQTLRAAQQSARTMQQSSILTHQSTGMLHQSIGMSMAHGGHGR